jgi:hypothetical protein
MIRLILAGMSSAVTERGAPAAGRNMPMSRTPVFISATDPISRAGVSSHLRPRPEVQLVRMPSRTPCATA